MKKILLVILCLLGAAFSLSLSVLMSSLFPPVAVWVAWIGIGVVVVWLVLRRRTKGEINQGGASMFRGSTKDGLL